MIKKFLIILFLVGTFFTTLTNSIYAQEEFAIDISSIYDFDISTNAEVTHNISIENLKPDRTSKAYTLNLKGISLKNLKAFEGEEELATTIYEKEDSKEVMIYFTEVVAGQGKKRNIKLVYDSDSYLKRVGDVWDLYIPYLQGLPQTRNADVTLVLPSQVANEAYIAPHTYEKTLNSKSAIFNFKNNSVLYKSIRAIYGDSQTYQVDLTYKLKNESIIPTRESIAIPPDTNRQKVVLGSLSVSPDDANINDDGNWIYYYDLAPLEEKTIEAKVFVQVFSESLRSENFVSPPANILANVVATTYWPSDDIEIQNLAKELKTADKIYRYVVDTLSYSQYEATPNHIRKGGKGALAESKSAICSEFTDLFITLSRAAGIPAREIVGYGFSDYREKEPLSLVTDVLHSWPEYWDEKQQSWIPVDPTWEDTSGEDYFSNLDTRHISFVIHGKDDIYPLPPGSYTQKDDPIYSKQVFVSVATPIDLEDVPLALSYKKIFTIPLIPTRSYQIVAKNEDVEAHYNEVINIDTDGNQKSIIVNAIPPLSSYITEHKVKYGILGLSSPKKTLVTSPYSSLEIKHSPWDIIIPFAILIFFIALTAIMIGLIIYFFPSRKLKDPF